MSKVMDAMRNMAKAIRDSLGKLKNMSEQVSGAVSSECPTTYRAV